MIMDAHNESRLLSLPQELQDMIHGFVFTDSVNVDDNNTGSTHPFLHTLITSRYKAIDNAKETYFKCATFRIGREFLKPFAKRNKEYLPLINDIHVIPPSIHETCREYIRIPKPEVEANDFLISSSIYALNWGPRTPSQIRDNAVRLQRKFFTKAKKEMRGEGVGKGVLKVAVVMFDEDDDPVKTVWTAEPLETTKECLKIAGY